MDHFTRLKRQIKQHVFLVILAANLSFLVTTWLSVDLFGADNYILLVVLCVLALVWAMIFSVTVTDYSITPVRLLWQAILHVSPGHSNTPAPDIGKRQAGRELITSLCLQVYQLASGTERQGSSSQEGGKAASLIADSLPLPLFVVGKDQTIVYTNASAARYLGKTTADITGQNIYSVLDLSFPSNDTFDAWLEESKSKTVTASHSWERVRLKQADESKPLQFDMAAYYNKDNPSNVEVILALFDHTESYSQADNESSYLELAVHELRTPLTLLRGYIEVFEEELNNKLDPQMQEFMRKMQVAAERLSALVSNILNVARVEANQLTLQLHEENWANIVSAAAKDLAMRAGIHNKSIVCDIAPDLPTVAVDKLSIYEVINNLLDNAIKYSKGANQKIIVKTILTSEGLVETTVQDFGVGIPTNVLPHLFEKFSRNFHTSGQVSGTGLGLYLSKAIISAHGGNIWVRSKEGEGTTLGFTVKPYSMLAQELKNSDNKDITREAYGWVKNHSLYRK